MDGAESVDNGGKSQGDERMSQNGRKTMKPAEFLEIRKRLGYSRDGFAIELGYEGTNQGNNNTIKRFESGDRPIPLPVAKLAWLMDRHGVPEWPMDLTAEPAQEMGNQG